MTQYSAATAVSRAAYQAKTARPIWYEKCLGFLVWCYFGGPTSGGYATAAATWLHTRYRHTTIPPAGAPCWWTGGRTGAGHDAVSAGGGYCYSTDFGPRGWIGDGCVRKIPISSIARYDRNLTYRGWSQDINGRVVVRVASPPSTSVSLSRLQRAAHRDPPAPNGSAYYAAGTRVVQNALHAEGLLPTIYYAGSFGTSVVKAYAAWQRRLGYSGSGADGIPGKSSLTTLGARHRFTVGN